MATTGSTVRHSVLLVDDEVALLETTAAVLERDFDVTTAAHGKQALALLQQRSFDMICADYSMPGMDGIELLGLAKELSPQSAFLLVTGLREHRATPFGVLLKPYKPEQLVRRIQLALAMTGMKHSLQQLDNTKSGLATTPR
jgi:CheY-like chemotaxis protein